MSKHSKSHRKQHEGALANTETRKLWEELLADWPTLNHVQRGDRIVPLLLAGCTNRGLAVGLGFDEGTIRRDLRIAALPPRDRAAIEAGARPDRFLFLQHRWEERVDDVSRMLQETLDGSISAELAGNVIWFLAVFAHGICFHPYMRDDLFEETIFRVWSLEGAILSNWMHPQWLPVHSSEMDQRNRSVVLLAHDAWLEAEDKTHDILEYERVIAALIKFMRKLEDRTFIIDAALQQAWQVIRCLDRNRESDLEIVSRARELTPQGCARLVQEHIRTKNSLANGSGRMVA